jgi:hypothetical protein
MCLHVGNLKPKFVKCGLPHKTENCGVKCGYCYGMGHIEDKCWKWGKDGKTTSTSNNYLEVLVNDEKVILEQLNRLCGTKHDISYGARIPKKILPMEIPDVKIIDERETIILTLLGIILFALRYYITSSKGIFLSPMETILVIFGELESLESLVKLTKKKHDKSLKTTNLTKVEGLHAIQIININKNCRNKALHLLVEINNNLINLCVHIYNLTHGVE